MHIQKETPVTGTALAVAGRKRKVHTKSRRGCGNCKIRRVKCDEGKPFCYRCRDYGVACSYGPGDSALRLPGEGTFVMAAVSPWDVPFNESLLACMNASLAQGKGKLANSPILQLSRADMELLHKFFDRTIITIGTPKNRETYRREGLRLACEHQFLMHTTLTVALQHDRSGDIFSKPGPRELYHSYHGTAQFRAKLAGPTTSSEKDALWMTSVMIGITVTNQMEADHAEDVWPLKDTPNDLDWVSFTDGKRHVWEVVDLSRPDSCLKHLASWRLYQNFDLEGMSIRESLKNVPPELVELCEVGDADDLTTHPYLSEVVFLGRLLTINCGDDTILDYLAFMGKLTPQFKDLLAEKDPRALLILAYFFQKLSCYPLWWTWRRAILEGPAIVKHLERNHADLPHLETLLQRLQLVTV